MSEMTDTAVAVAGVCWELWAPPDLAEAMSPLTVEEESPAVPRGGGRGSREDVLATKTTGTPGEVVPLEFCGSLQIADTLSRFEAAATATWKAASSLSMASPQT